MLRYLRAAFFVRPSVPGLGRFPVNLLFVAAMAILGFGHPAFWLLGLGLETAFLALLATSGRFQKVVDARDAHTVNEGWESRRRQLIAQLPAESQQRLNELEKKIDRVLDLYRSTDADPVLVQTNGDALRKLQWVHLKLLISRHHLGSDESRSAEREVRGQIDSIDKELAHGKMSPTVRESKQATLDLLRKRLAMLEGREHTLAEIDSDLTRIETQADLAVEQALERGKPAAISANISLASRLLDAAALGDSGSLVADLERDLAPPMREPA